MKTQSPSTLSRQLQAMRAQKPETRHLSWISTVAASASHLRRGLKRVASPGALRTGLTQA